MGVQACPLNACGIFACMWHLNDVAARKKARVQNHDDAAKMQHVHRFA